VYFQTKLGFKRNPIHTDCEFILDCVIGQVRRELQRELQSAAHALTGLDIEPEVPAHDSTPATNFGPSVVVTEFVFLRCLT
jgi:hypothetical protein